jgi:hypothetical protein
MKEVNVLKATQQNCARVIYFIALAVSLTGCWVIPFHDTSDRAVDLTEVESLIGANETAVIDRIGPPTYRVTQSHVDYLVYEGHLDATAAVFALWVPVGILPISEKGLDCLRLEFKNSALQSYEIETRSTVYHGRLKDCRTLFWSAEDIEQIDPLLGTSMAKVKNTFGEPHWMVQDKNNIYLIYQYSRPLTLANACVLLDFGDQYTLRRYEIKSCGLFGEDCPTHPAGKIEWGGLDCRQLFWTLDQLKTLVPEDTEPSIAFTPGVPSRYDEIAGLTHEELLARAEEGNAEAQLQLYWSTKGTKRLAWLCRAADQGHADAQYRLGLLHRYGNEGLRQDPMLAYMWYRLAASKGHYAAAIDAPVSIEDLTAGQAMEAEILVQKWRPGQCERDLPFTDADN